VRAAPMMDATYARLVPRFHYLWATLADDPETLAAKLSSATRDQMLVEVDDRIRDPSGAAYEVREGRRRELAELEAWIAAVALAALDRFGG